MYFMLTNAAFTVSNEKYYKNYYICIYAFSRCFYPKRLTVHLGYTFFVSMCVPWELNPQPLRC